MSENIAKTATITDGTTVLELPLTKQKVTSTNNINSFAKPNEDPPQRRALNLNRWEFARQVTATVTDAFVDKTHNGSNGRPDLSNKEQWLDELYRLAVSQNILDLEVVNGNTSRSGGETMPHAVTSGYIHNLDFVEKGGQDNSVYEVTVKIVDEVPMNS